MRELIDLGNIAYGLLAGGIFGILSVVIMIPLKFDDKFAAMSGSFINRFAIGFLTAVTVLPIDGWIKGLLIGVLLSLPDALITKAYAPILGLGIIGGTLIGLLVG